MLHLWPSLLEDPPKGKLDVLHQMASQLDMSNISWVIQWSNIVMLQDTGSIEVVHKTFATTFIERAIVEIADYILNDVQEAGTLLPRVTHLAEAGPETDDNDLGFRPALMHLVDQLDIRVVELLMGDIVAGIVVISADVDHRNVCCRMRREVPVRNVRSIAVDLQRPVAGIWDLQPLEGLAVEVAIALLVVKTYPWVGSDAELDVTETVPSASLSAV